MVLVLLTNGTGTTWMDIQMQKNESGPLPLTIYKINLKRIIDLNMRTKTIKLLKQVKIFMNLTVSLQFLWYDTTAQATKGKNGQIGLHQN